MCGGTTSARCSHAKLPAGRPPPRKRDGTRQAFGASEEVAQPQRASAANVPRAQSESKHEEVHGSGARMRVDRAGPATPLPSIIFLPLVERPGWSRREAGPPYHNRVGCCDRLLGSADAWRGRREFEGDRPAGEMPLFKLLSVLALRLAAAGPSPKVSLSVEPEPVRPHRRLLPHSRLPGSAHQSSSPRGPLPRCENAAPVGRHRLRAG